MSRAFRKWVSFASVAILLGVVLFWLALLSLDDTVNSVGVAEPNPRLAPRLLWCLVGVAIVCMTQVVVIWRTSPRLLWLSPVGIEVVLSLGFALSVGQVLGEVSEACGGRSLARLSCSEHYSSLLPLPWVGGCLAVGVLLGLRWSVHLSRERRRDNPRDLDS